MKDEDDDMDDVREIGSKDNVDNVTDEGLGHDKICVDVLDRNICMRCYEGGEILVCSEIGCPVVVHAKCIGCEPRFDDMGKYYCPYCWLKRTLVEVQVLRNKALTAKKDLADFLDGLRVLAACFFAGAAATDFCEAFLATGCTVSERRARCRAWRVTRVVSFLGIGMREVMRGCAE